MSAAISRSEAVSGVAATAPETSPVFGQVRLAVAGRDGATVISDLYQKTPLRVLFPHSREPAVPVVALITTTGGLVGGDRLAVSVDAGPGANLLITGQAAEKVYRSTGAEVRVAVDLSAAAGSWLEWLPQETILFEASRLVRTTTLNLRETARVLAGEILVFGRTASGERLRRGRVREAWEVRRDGRLIWRDAFEMAGDLADPLAAPACLDGAAAVATAVFAGPDAGSALPTAQALIDDQRSHDLRSAATIVGGVLVVRWIGRDAARLRVAFGTFWAAFRHQVAGRERRLPRLWMV